MNKANVGHLSQPLTHRVRFPCNFAKAKSRDSWGERDRHSPGVTEPKVEIKPVFLSELINGLPGPASTSLQARIGVPARA